jgi:magnesium and cobalt exporter, CNNM family
MGETGFGLMIIMLLLLLVFSAFFSGSETALMAISKIRLKHLAEKRPVRVRLVQQLLEKPEKLIGAILLGNNLVNVAMSAIATAMAISYWGERGIAYVTGILTIVILIFAEITPKVYAKHYNERVSFLTAPIMNVIMIMLNPIVTAVTFISNRLLYLIGIDVSRIKIPPLTEEEIKTYIRIGWGDGAITTDERRMLSRVFTLNDKTVGEMMIHRENMAIIDVDASLQEILKIILETGYSRFPVKKGSGLEIIGFIHAKDLFRFMDKGKPEDLKEIIRPPYFIPADKKIDEQLRSFQALKLHQAVVQDIAGKVVGLITVEDILEELVGSIQDEHD